MRRVTLLRALVTVSVLAACAGPSAPTATPTPEPTPTPVEVIADKVEDLVGIWACILWGEGAYVQFLADGSLRMAQTVEDLENDWFGSGEFWFEGTVFNESTDYCAGKGTYEVRLVREGGKTVALRWKAIEDPCSDRRTAYRLTKRASSE